MSYQESSGYCEYCQKQVLIRQKGINHIFHLLMTLITFGVWIIVWLGVSIKVGGWRCTHCGSKVTKKSELIWILALLSIIILGFWLKNLSSKHIVFSNAVLNVRTGPGPNYEKIDKLTQFQRAEIIKERGNWAKIKYDNKTGWVSKNYLVTKKEKK